MGIMFGLPKLTKKIPAALIAIIVVACITILGGIEMSTVGSFIAEGGGKGLILGLCVAFIGLAVDNLIRTWANKRKKLLGLEEY